MVNPHGHLLVFQEERASRKDDSFPYLHLSQRLCLPYGRVLAYVDMLDRRPTKPWMHAEVDKLEEADMERIMAVWRQEMSRRGVSP